VSAKDETQQVTAPLTTAISTRAYEVGGIGSGSLVGPEEGDEGAHQHHSGSKKEFKGDKPWIMVDGFHIKIDGCVGESFIRSYAFLTRSTDLSDAIAAW
jgi:hypothetical protein